MKMTNAEKLILAMLCDLNQQLKVKGEIDPAFIRSAIIDDQTWSIPWEYPGVFAGSSEGSRPPHLSLVLNVLEMWEILEQSFAALSAPDQTRVKDETKPFAGNVRFPGFDGNNESEYLASASFLIEKMGRYAQFAGRDLNSHMETVEMYERMLAAYKLVRAALGSRFLNADEIIKVLLEMVHPSHRS